MKKLMITLIISLMILSGCNTSNYRYDVIDYQIVYDLVIIRVEFRHNTIEKFVCKPEDVFCTDESKAYYCFSNDNLYLPRKEYDNYKEILLKDLDD